MPTHRTALLALAVLGTLTLLAFTPNVAAAAYLEGFEEFEHLETPSSDSYTFAVSGTGSAVVTTALAAPGSEKSLQVATTGPQFRATMQSDGTPTFDCSAPDLDSVSWDYRFAQLPTAGDRYEMGVSSISHDFDGDAGEYLGIAITETGDVRAIYNTNAGAQVDAASLGFTAAINTWYSFTITCTATAATWSESTTALPPVSTSAVLTLNKPFFSIDIDPLASAAQTFFDNINFGDFTPTEAANIFCSGAAEDNFGYDYVKGVSFDEDASTGVNGLEEAYVFSAEEDDPDFLGKAFVPGSKALSTVARFESGIADGVPPESSNFRIAYTTGAGTLSAGSTGDDAGDETLAGDGRDSGNFANNLQAYFLEDGDNWVITIRYNLAGTGLTTLDQSVVQGDPDGPATYVFEVNTGSTALDPHPMVGESPFYTANDDASTEDFPALPAMTARVVNRFGEVVIERAIPAGFAGFEWKEQWFIGEGDSSVFDAKTYLAENEEGNSQPSTCVYDLLGTAECVGSCGSEPSDDVPPPEAEEENPCTSAFCVDAASVPEGFTAATFNGFLGLILVGMMTIGGAGAMHQAAPGLRVGAIIVGIFAFIGYLIAFNFGLLPLWPLVLAVVVGAGLAIFLGSRGR